MVSAHPHNSARFNVLLTEDRDHAPEHWTRTLPRLMQPMGIESYVARTGEEAVELTRRIDIHAALIDWATPRDTPSATDDAGLWLLEVLGREPKTLPMVMVNSRVLTTMQVHKFLNDALRLGAFTVVNRPVELESLLAVIQRVLDRHFDGAWPNRFPDS